MVPFNVIKVSKAPLLACLTCPLCGSLLEEATTICECLHTFCRECIEDRLSAEDENDCPICDVYLGCTPLDKLRADPQLDEVRNKLFALGSNKRKGACLLQPAKRKERSLSSLGISSMPSSSKRSPMRTRRSRSNKHVAAASSSDDRDSGDEEGACRKAKYLVSRDDFPISAYSTYVSEDGKLYYREDKGKSVEPSPLEYLADLADAAEEEFSPLEAASGGGRQCSTVADDTRPTTRSASRYGKLSRPTKGVNRTHNGHASGAARNLFVWLALKASENQPEEAALPELVKPYLRIRCSDGRVPVSILKKYLMKKLDLKSEAEVEITCCNQPVVSSLPLEAVKSIWLAKPRHPPEADTGCSSPSTHQLLMTLNYKRNTRAVIT